MGIMMVDGLAKEEGRFREDFEVCKFGLENHVTLALGQLEIFLEKYSDGEESDIAEALFRDAKAQLLEVLNKLEKHLGEISIVDFTYSEVNRKARVAGTTAGIEIKFNGKSRVLVSPEELPEATQIKQSDT